MTRNSRAQDISWFLDLHTNGQLELEPPYQRRSVWTAKDRKFYLDTVMKNYPSPAIFVHKELSETGKAKYNIIDGKQRLETIIKYAEGKLKLDDDMGDDRLNGKKFNELSNDQKSIFWNYIIPVDFLDTVDSTFLNEAFDRLNRNSRKLNKQEIRHARYTGWFITYIEREVDADIWDLVKISTKASARRMSDLQFISELFMAVVSEDCLKFSQDNIDQFYADYDDDSNEQFNTGALLAAYNDIKSVFESLMDDAGHKFDQRLLKKRKNDLYTIWTAIIKDSAVFSDPGSIDKLESFYTKVCAEDESDEYVRKYIENSSGASTELEPRLERREALLEYMRNEG